MFVRRFALVAAIALVGACGFEHGELRPDGAPPGVTVAFGDTGSDVDEEFGTLKVPVVLTAASSEEVSVDYAVTSGTASRPDDFVLADDTLTFRPGETQRDIDVRIASDTLEEPDEDLVVTLANPEGATLGANTAHTVTISSSVLARVKFADPTPSAANESTNAQVEVILSIPAPETLTVQLAVMGTATPGSDHGATSGQLITFAPNAQSQLVSLGVLQDALDEFDETIVLGFQNPSPKLLVSPTDNTRQHTITDDDPEPTVSYTATTSTTPENQSIDLTVTLSAPSGRPVTVDYAVTGGTAGSTDAMVTGAPGSITFMPGQTSKMITVAVLDDTLDEISETLAVTLMAPVNATLGTNTTNTLTITDNDSPPSVGFVQATTSVMEGATTVNLSVALSTASGLDVTVPFAIDNTSTANDPADYTPPVASSIAIPAGMTTANVAITVKTDTLDEANETVVVDLLTPTNATLGATASETLTITDDDAAPTVAFATSTASPNEGNTNVTLTVQLSTASGLEVTVPYTIDATSTAANPADYTIAPTGQVTIPAGQTSATITVAVKEDSTNEPDETVIATLGTPTNATLGATTTFTLTINEDGDAEPDVRWDPLETNRLELEGTSPPGQASRTVTFTLELTAASGFTITVPINYSGSAEDNDYDGPATVTFAPGATTATVTLTIFRDNNQEQDDAITMTIVDNEIANAGTATPTQRTYTILDDD